MKLRLSLFAATIDGFSHMAIIIVLLKNMMIKVISNRILKIYFTSDNEIQILEKSIIFLSHSIKIRQN